MEGFSVTGGYVYRGPIQDLQGHYFFADFVTDRIWSFKWDRSNPALADGSNFTDFIDWTDVITSNIGSISNISSFAEDALGNLYIIDLNGEIFRVDFASIPESNIVSLVQGFNLFSYPGEVPTDLATCKFLLDSIGLPAEVESISRFDRESQLFEECTFENNQDFPIVANEGYVLKMLVSKDVKFEGGPLCSDVTATVGLNLIGHSVPNSGLNCFDVLAAFGESEIGSLQHFDTQTGTLATCTYSEGAPAGTNFPIRIGMGYILHARSDFTLEFPGCNIAAPSGL